MKNKNPISQSRKHILVTYKGGKCFDCGNTFPDCCYDFDHRDLETKSFAVGWGIGRHLPISELLIEADKCDLVCACCHRIRTESDYHIVEKLRERSKGNRHALGRHHTSAAKEKIRNAAMGNKRSFGCTRSEETRKKLSSVASRWQKGRKMPIQTIYKISQAMKQKSNHHRNLKGQFIARRSNGENL